ncbi:MAG: hypothetical protein IPJ19_03790 [Planctomycetes bacterium]|nr:hypothetical protein [Planctomycetota bacterium]
MPPRPLHVVPFLVLAACASAQNPPPAPKPAAAPKSAPAPSTATTRTIRFGDSVRDEQLAPMFPGTSYDPQVPVPDSLLRQPLGTFTAHHAEILTALRAMAEKSPRMRIFPFGRTHEGRELVGVVIASPENLARLDSIQANLGKLADPRGVSQSELDSIVSNSPAVAWLGFSIHGDEMSGADASLAVAYQFAAGTSADVTDVLKDVVVVIDPALNPDGRERILSQLEQSAGYVPNLDNDAMQRGRWPYGRGNHYLFDMNRDWMWGTQPETRARWAAIQKFHPQLLTDAHEMGGLDTYLFYPATDPFTPYFPEHTKTWWRVFAAEQGAAFDKYGWSYYTREWADSWYPGYTDSWGTFQGAVGILYEQARFAGQALRRASGEIATYREAVQHQAVSTVSNTTTLAKHRKEILAGFLAQKQQNCAADTVGNERMFVLVPGRHPDREKRLVEMLAGQGIEVTRADAKFAGAHAESTLGSKQDAREFPAGSLVVQARQPLATLVKALLVFDPHYDQKSLDAERKELERKQSSKAYDVTAWSPAHAFDVDGFWCDAQDVKGAKVTTLEPPKSGLAPLAKAEQPVYGWVVDGQDDRALNFAVQAMELELQVEISEEPFSIWSSATADAKAEPIRRCVRGSLLVRRHENTADAAARVERAAKAAGVLAYAAGTARSADEGPDLGGQKFHLLARPRVALLSNNPVSSDNFGHTWHMIDTELGLPCSLVNAQELGGYDLRKYNVLILPEAGGELRTILKDNADSLQAWIQAGGTLIASGASASMLLGKDLGFSSVRPRSEALADLPKYAEAVKREREAGKTPVDAETLFGTPKPAPEAEPKDGDAKKDDKPAAKKDAEELARWDKWARTFSPRGVLLRGEVNTDEWLTYGCGTELPVFFEGSQALLSELPVHTPVRLAAADRLRLSGLLWPEARDRIADSAWCTRERKGSGQVILFACSPDFRNWFRGTMRLYANAIVYGPGVGANQPTKW